MKQAVKQPLLNKSSELFIPYVVVGDPSLEVTERVIEMLAESGADAVELGVPYSDPLADGPVIQRAASRALDQGVSLKDVLQVAANVKKRGVDIPLVLFSYYNPVLQFGEEAIVQEAKRAGIDAFLIPDLPLEESEEFTSLAQAQGLSMISLVAPTSHDRIEYITKRAEGFVYLVSSLGVTGERSNYNEEVYQFIERVKQTSTVPVAVGFGISSREQVDQFWQHADGVIIGSAIVRTIEENRQLLSNENTMESGLKNIKAFVESLISS
ncbi:tryptophan synthase subunit alpha [Texcoconibacillus texcoconensis]|uniref:Tryptophan synthase alpha chain n=1 Tax=Texcoconibacillus texcoconensis TaxID=1095777 RepID=A0A840QNG4_9BACI|nr:tryptophan synthase subunit alpha [Texcoconibacillus texcoconensis]MBB5172881.1 tryptophan synthase alpha chain [Texcoconibacillus texcoconensis]